MKNKINNNKKINLGMEVMIIPEQQLKDFCQALLEEKGKSPEVVESLEITVNETTGKDVVSFKEDGNTIEMDIETEISKEISKKIQRDIVKYDGSHETSINGSFDFSHIFILKNLTINM